MRGSQPRPTANAAAPPRVAMVCLLGALSLAGGVRLSSINRRGAELALLIGRS